MTRDGKEAKDREYHRNWMRVDYAENPEKYRDRSHGNYHNSKGRITTTKKERCFRNKIICVEYLGSICVDCGDSLHPSKMQFHHREPSEKEYGISSKLSNGWSLDRLKPELDKCDLLCSNCHAYIEWCLRHPELIKEN